MATLRTDFKVVNVTENRKRRSKSVGSAAKNTGAERATSLTPTSVLELFRAHKKPLKWPEIRDLAGVRQGADVDQLRRVLRGLCHAGDLHIDSRGAYQLAAVETSVDGVIRKNDRGRLVLLPKAGGDALPVRLTRDSRLRVGDTVHARLVEGQAVISRRSRRVRPSRSSVARSQVHGVGTSSPKAISAGDSISCRTAMAPHPTATRSRPK